MTGRTETGILHTFAKVHFNSPTFCDYCREFIWGIGKQGFSCRVCYYAIHKRCLEHYPATCQAQPVRKDNTSFVGPQLHVNSVEPQSLFLIVEAFEGSAKNKADLYCSVEFNSLRHKTKTIEQSLNPYWNEKFAFTISNPAEVSSKQIIVTLYERSRWSSDLKMGITTIAVQPFLESENNMMVKDQWFKIDTDKERAKSDSREFEVHLKIWMTKNQYGQPPPILKECHMVHRARPTSQMSPSSPVLSSASASNVAGSATNLSIPSPRNHNSGSLRGAPAGVRQSDAAIVTSSSLGTTSSGSLTVDLPEIFSIINKNDVDSFLTWVHTASSDELNHPDHWGYTPLMSACSNNCHEQIIAGLLELDGVSVTLESKDGNTALHYFCQKFDSPDCYDIFNLFIKKGANVNHQNINGESPLFKATVNRYIRLILVEFLLENGADVNLRNKSNEGVLHYAVRFRRHDLVSVLLNAGADVNVRGTKEGKNPHELALTYNDPKMARHIQLVQELVEWLEKNDLIKYKLIFIKKELYLPKFAAATEETLKKMGIADAEERQKVHEKMKAVKERNKEHNPEDPSDGALNSTEDDNISTTWMIRSEDVEYTKKLGSGTSGDVYRGLFSQKPVAIKVLKEMNSEKEKEEFMKEFQIMSSVKSQHLVHFFGVTLKPKMCMVMELCSRGSVFDILQDEHYSFGWDRLFYFACGATAGVVDLHNFTPSILHRDLKSLNLLVTDGWKVKVCDFGLSRFNENESSETLQKMRGTMAYCAPETYFGVKFTTKSDVYSLGVLVWEMVYRCIKQKYERPFGEYPNLKLDFQIIVQSAKQKLRPTIPPTTPPMIKDVINQCFSGEPEQRPSAPQLLESLKACQDDFKKSPSTWTSSILPKS